MRRTGIFWLIYPALFAAVVIGLALFVPARRGSSARQLLQSGIPAEGWAVCAVGGIEYIEEIGASRQVFDLCQGQGWRYKAYCLNPQMPAPALDTRCSVLENETVWCGDMVQQLRLYRLLEEAQDTATPTPTRTPTRTSTPTLPSTATATATATPTRTSTVVFPGEEYPPRPRPGGPGNVEALALLAGLLGGSAGIFTFMEVQNRRQRSAALHMDTRPTRPSRS